MSVKLRIATIRLYDKCQKNLEYSKKIGITATINNNSEMKEFNAFVKAPDHIKQTYWK